MAKNAVQASSAGAGEDEQELCTFLGTGWFSVCDRRLVPLMSVAGLRGGMQR